MDNPQELTVLSLCTGYGGLELGLSRALENPLRVIAVEIEAWALANLEVKASQGKLAIEALYPDIKTFPAERFSGCFDFILAGYPCQPFSVAGKRQGTDDPRHLWPHIARIVKAVRPVWCFFENVAGHLTLGFPEVYCNLRDMGYSVEAGLFTASEVGAPHKRQRLFILANRTSNDEWDGSQRSTTGQDTQRDRIRTGIRSLQIRDISRNGDRWPARPGQPQYPWEEPRVVVGDSSKRRGIQSQAKEASSESHGRSRNSGELADSRSFAPEGLPQPEERDCDREVGNAGGQGQALGQLGRVSDERTAGVDPIANRVDRLRLLGNGCIPAQAEKAFRELI